MLDDRPTDVEIKEAILWLEMDRAEGGRGYEATEQVDRVIDWLRSQLAPPEPPETLPPKTRLTRAEMNAVRDGARPAIDLMPFAAPDQRARLAEWAKKHSGVDLG